MLGVSTLSPSLPLLSRVSVGCPLCARLIQVTEKDNNCMITANTATDLSCCPASISPWEPQKYLERRDCSQSNDAHREETRLPTRGSDPAGPHPDWPGSVLTTTNHQNLMLSSVVDPPIGHFTDGALMPTEGQGLLRSALLRGPLGEEEGTRPLLISFHHHIHPCSGQKAPADRLGAGQLHKQPAQPVFPGC